MASENQSFHVMKETVLGSTRTVLFTPQGVSQNYGPQVVPPGQFFVLGDNRDSSDDSRYWGMVPVENIDGRVFTIWLSLDWQKPVGGMPQVRWDRILASIR
jgi:signal peptidase I